MVNSPSSLVGLVHRSICMRRHFVDVKLRIRLWLAALQIGVCEAGLDLGRGNDCPLLELESFGMYFLEITRSASFTRS